MDTNRIMRIMNQYGCSAETAQRFVDLREEGYTSYQAAIMAGLRDPDEAKEE